MAEVPWWVFGKALRLRRRTARQLSYFREAATNSRSRGESRHPKAEDWIGLGYWLQDYTDPEPQRRALSAVEIASGNPYLTEGRPNPRAISRFLNKRHFRVTSVHSSSVIKGIQWFTQRRSRRVWNHLRHDLHVSRPTQQRMLGMRRERAVA